MSGVRHLYVHLPFCAHRCGYCDFVTVVGREESHARYVDAVLAELDLVDLDREGPALEAVEAPERTALERSAAYRAYHRRLEDGLRFLSSTPIEAAA